MILIKDDTWSCFHLFWIKHRGFGRTEVWDLERYLVKGQSGGDRDRCKKEKVHGVCLGRMYPALHFFGVTESINIPKQLETTGNRSE